VVRIRIRVIVVIGAAIRRRAECEIGFWLIAFSAGDSVGPIAPIITTCVAVAVITAAVGATAATPTTGTTAAYSITPPSGIAAVAVGIPIGTAVRETAALARK
jgi:hypothetical protein